MMRAPRATSARDPWRRRGPRSGSRSTARTRRSAARQRCSAAARDASWRSGRSARACARCCSAAWACCKRPAHARAHFEKQKKHYITLHYMTWHYITRAPSSSRPAHATRMPPRPAWFESRRVALHHITVQDNSHRVRVFGEDGIEHAARDGGGAEEERRTGEPEEEEGGVRRTNDARIRATTQKTDDSRREAVLYDMI